MSRAKPKPPSVPPDPRLPKNWGADGVALAAQPDVTVILDQRRRVQTAHRADVFDRLRLSDAQRRAARRLEADLETARGVGDPGQRAIVDCASCQELITGRMISASRRVASALAALDPRHARMVTELLEPRHVHTLNPTERWRLVVAWATGRKDRDAQADQVRQSCQRLAVHYGLAQPAEQGQESAVARDAR